MAATTATASSVKQAAKYLIGKCIPSWKSNAARIQIPLYEYDANLHMHFRTNEYLYAHDPHKLCKSGDMVLIESLPEKMTRLIEYKVIDVIFPLGNITDPISGKKVTGNQYRDTIKEKNELHGKSEASFDYDKAPPRGYLEDIRDYTHKPAYKKYYVDPNDPQPYAL